jgi:hypothetical protein
VVALEPGFGIGKMCAALDPALTLSVPLTEALRAACLPE